MSEDGKYATIEETAAKFNSTARTVYDWIKRGMPGACALNGRRVVDLELASPWIQANFKNARGGRPKMRIKPTLGPNPGVTTPPVSHGRPKPTSDSFTTGLETEPNAEPTEAEIDASNAAAVDLIRNRIKAKNELNEHRKKAGDLLDAKEVEATWTRTLQRVREAINGLPARVARDAAVELGLDQVSEVRLRRMIDDHIDRLSNSLTGSDGSGAGERVPASGAADGERVGGSVPVHQDAEGVGAVEN